MWHEIAPSCSAEEWAELPGPRQAYYVPNAQGRWVLDDLLGHIKSVQTPQELLPAYQIRQYSHRRAAFLKREQLPPDELAHQPRYPGTRAEYERWPNADSLRAELLYDMAGRLQAEFQEFWGS